MSAFVVQDRTINRIVAYLCRSGSVVRPAASGPVQRDTAVPASPNWCQAIAENRLLIGMMGNYAHTLTVAISK